MKIKIKHTVFVLSIITLMFLSMTIRAYANELSEEEALKILIESLKSTEIVDLKQYHLRHGLCYTAMFEVQDLYKYRALEEKGFIILKSLAQNGKDNGLKKYEILFTEKAEPYIKKDEDTKDKILVSLGKAEKIDITSLKKAGENKYEAEFLIGYRLTPIGEVLLGKQMIFERKEDAFLEYRDNGWKVRFKISF